MATIQGVYVALFGRPADPLGLAYFNEVTQDGADLTAIGDLAATAEFQARFEGQTNAQIVTAIYQSLFNRNPELAGLQFFVTALNNGTLNVNNVAIAILDGAQGDDLATVNNKIEAANAFTAAIDTADEIAGYQGDTAAEQGRLFLQGVTSDDDSIPDEAATDQAVAAAVAAGGSGGAEFVLTPGDDFADQASAFRNDGDIESDFRFSSGNQTVTASSATLGAGDILSDNSTTDNDRLNVAVNGDISVIDGAMVMNIETINLTLANAFGDFDLTNYTGVQTVNVSGSVNSGDDVYLVGFADSGVATFNFSGLTSLDAGDEAGIDDSTADQDITYTGHAFDDYVELGDGDNSISTGAGNDEVYLGDGDNSVATGAGGDYVSVGDGDNTIALGDGINELDAGDGDNTVTSGSGVDDIDVGDGDNTISTGAAADVVVAGDGDNTIDTGAGDDSIEVGDGDNMVTGGAGADAINLNGTGENVVIIGDGETGITASTIDEITNFSTGDDMLDLDGLVGDATGGYEEIDQANAGDFADALAAANVEFVNGAGATLYVFAYDDGNGDGYLFIDSDLNGEADAAVKLIGGNTMGFFAEGDIA